MKILLFLLPVHTYIHLIDMISAYTIKLDLPYISIISKRGLKMQDLKDKICSEVARRKTFAIISHPDAGKTTLTEKLLLYGGAIRLAGSVKARKANKYAVSDWMEIEKQRGISVTSSVLQFQYNDFCINILDTPGHQD